MPFDDLLTPVAEPPVPRHDAATCCGERQGTDVGEGWRWLMPDEILREGDEYYSVNHCCFNATGDCGLPANHEGGAGPYRRRVTPVEQPLGACLDEENNELREQVATLTAEVERLRLTREERNTLERISFLLTHHNIARDAKTIALIAARQGGGE